MALRVGDPAFTHLGMPSVVIAKDDSKHEFILDSDPKLSSTVHRHGYIQGLSLDNRESFNAIMDEVKGLEDPQGRIKILQEKISLMENHEEEPKRQLAGYLRAELNHIMNTHNVSPRYYEIPFNKAP